VPAARWGCCLAVADEFVLLRQIRARAVETKCAVVRYAVAKHQRMSASRTVAERPTRKSTKAWDRMRCRERTAGSSIV
jgi:hypothetical protein